MAGLVTVAVVLALAAPAGMTVREGFLFQDDAFLYFEIARRMWSGQGSTFNGLTTTNGYHPLWQLLLVPIGPIMNASREAGMKAVLLLDLGLLGIGLSLLARTARRLNCAAPGAVVAMAGVPLALSAIRGMEASLCVALLGLLLWLQAKYGPPVTGLGGLRFGLVIAALAMARIDPSFVVAANLAWVLMLRSLRSRQARSAAGRAWLCAVAVQIVVGLTYLLSNRYLFGIWGTTSMLAKMDRAVRSYGILRSPLTLLAIAGSAAAVARAWRWLVLEPDWALSTAALGSLLMTALHAVVAASPETFNWYFAMPVFCSGLLLDRALPARWARARAVRWVWCGFVVATGVICLAGRVRAAQSSSESYSLALWLRDCAPDDAILAMADPGIIAYFGERPVVNLDRLTSDAAHRHAVLESRLPEYLVSLVNTAVWPVHRPHGVAHRAPAERDAGGLFRVPLWLGCEGTLIPQGLTAYGYPLPRTCPGPYTCYRVVSVAYGSGRAHSAP